MNRLLLQYTPWFVVACAAIYLFSVAMQSPNHGYKRMDLEAFGKIPVRDHGRVKPIDTLARTNLMIISSRQTYRDADDNKLSATRWLLDVMTARMAPDTASQKIKSVRIDDAKLLELMALPERSGSLYSFAELGPNLGRLMEEANRARKIDENKRSAYDAKVLELALQAVMYQELAEYETPHKVFRIDNDQVLKLLNLEPREGFRYSFGEILPRVGLLYQEGQRASQIKEKEQSPYEVKLVNLLGHIQLYVHLAQLEGETLQMLPPPAERADWQTFNDLEKKAQASAMQRLQVQKERGELNVEKMDRQQLQALVMREVDNELARQNPAAPAFTAILKDYQRGQGDRFNQDVAEYSNFLAYVPPGEMRTVNFEAFFNRLEPFYQASILDVLVFVLACAAWLVFPEVLNRSAFWLAATTLVLHSFALIARMYIQGRPPVTNLYSSAVFIGWGCVVMGLTLELLYRNGLGNVLAAVLGALTMFIAHHLAAGGDSLEMMRAVLDTNFWLATHVTCVTLGYTATFVAGFLGIIFVCMGVFTKRLDRDMLKSLTQMIYGIVCFATLLSFTGTILGGIWADYSWGRFWGWDPKENGALLIVLWNALILHARWGGIVKQRGMALLAIVGNMVTGWSWFGTNQLGVGLHAYGFNNTLATGLTVFWIFNLILIGIGLLPMSRWRSFANEEAGPRPAQRSPKARRRMPAGAAAN